MISGEILFQGARDNLFPKRFLNENEQRAPTTGLLLSNLIVQLFLILILVNEEAYNFTVLLASSTVLVPYIFVSMSQAKLSRKWTNGGIDKNVIVGILSSIYMIYCMYASGFEYIFLTTLIFAPAIILYMRGQKEAEEPAFNSYEKVGAVIIIICAIIAIYLIASGAIDLTTA